MEKYTCENCDGDVCINKLKNAAFSALSFDDKTKVILKGRSRRMIHLTQRRGPPTYHIVMKKYQEWCIPTAWGKLAMVSWGSPSAPPVLMLHGYMDTAATFILLAENLTEHYYYVAVDLPGHGKSDPLPPGPLINLGHLVEVLRAIVDHMKWQSFIYMGHSIGGFLGCLYHKIYPGRINRMVWIDPAPSLNPYYQINYKPETWYWRYHMYYENYFGKSAADKPKLYKYNDIVKLVSKNRRLNNTQAEVVLSRSLIEVSDGLYRLSWEPRVKFLSTLALCEDNISEILFNNAPPTLILKSSVNYTEGEMKKFTTKLTDRFHSLRNCTIIDVVGHHDVHITSPKLIGTHINNYLKMEHIKSKI